MENMELTVENLMAMGYSEEDAKAICDSNKGGSSGLPFNLLKINYDAEVTKKGTWVADIVKDDNGDVTDFTEFGDEITMIILGSKYQYTRYNSTTNSADVSSNFFDLADTKQAYDLKTGKKISELKKDDTENKIKFQEVMLVLVSSKKQPEPKPYIFYSKGAFLYTFNQCRKSLPNNGNVMYKLSFKLKTERKGATKFYTVDEKSFVATPRTMEEIKADAHTIPKYIKEFNIWVGSVNDKSTNNSAKEIEVDEDDDDVTF